MGDSTHKPEAETLIWMTATRTYQREIQSLESKDGSLLRLHIESRIFFVFFFFLSFSQCVKKIYTSKGQKIFQRTNLNPLFKRSNDIFFTILKGKNSQISSLKCLQFVKRGTDNKYTYLLTSTWNFF